VWSDLGDPIGHRILYVASDNPMNKKGLADFFHFAWDRIRRAVPDAELLVAGKISRAVPQNTPGVIPLGTVEDLQPLYRQARLVINPAVAGTGLAIKTLEALCRFRPIVAWPNGVQGLSSELAGLCTTARDWFEFAERVIALLESDVLQSGFSAEQRSAIVRSASPDVAYGEMTRVIEAFFQQQHATERAVPTVCV
jgi:glycosyltransferase involved in cell wall biosynthesis